MARARASLIIATATVFIMLIVMYAVFNYHNYLLLSLGIIGGIMMLFFIRFEIKTVKTREIVILALLAAIGAVARVPFAGLPSVQPTSFVIITVGLVFGAESGFLVGALGSTRFKYFFRTRPMDSVANVCLGNDGNECWIIKTICGHG